MCHGHVKAEPSGLCLGQTKPPLTNQTRSQYCQSPATLNRTPLPQQSSVSFMWEWRIICAHIFSLATLEGSSESVFAIFY